MRLEPASKEEMRTLMSGYLDGELEGEDRLRLEIYLAESAEGRRELDEMRRLMAAVSSLHVKGPPDEAWDHFLDNVYNRAERRMGWFLLIAGVVAMAFSCVYYFAVADWANAWQKAVVAAPLAGLFLLFASVLRQRLIALPTDRYSRDVKR